MQIALVPASSYFWRGAGCRDGMAGGSRQEQQSRHQNTGDPADLSHVVALQVSISEISFEVLFDWLPQELFSRPNTFIAVNPRRVHAVPPP